MESISPTDYSRRPCLGRHFPFFDRASRADVFYRRLSRYILARRTSYIYVYGTRAYTTPSGSRKRITTTMTLARYRIPNETSRHSSRRCRVSRDALFFSHSCLHARSCKHFAVSLRGDWYATREGRHWRTVYATNDEYLSYGSFLREAMLTYYRKREKDGEISPRTPKLIETCP